MTPNNVIANLNREVRYIGNDRPELKNKSFTFAGATIRRKTDSHGNQGPPFYQAELIEHVSRTIYITNLKDIETIEE